MTSKKMARIGKNAIEQITTLDDQNNARDRDMEFLSMFSRLHLDIIKEGNMLYEERNTNRLMETLFSVNLLLGTLSDVITSYVRDKVCEGHTDAVPTGIDIIGLGNTVKKLRKRKHLSQKNLAKQADIPAYRISRIERGTEAANIHDMLAIAGALDKHLEDITVPNYIYSD